jgi:hypothetical protein
MGFEIWQGMFALVLVVFLFSFLVPKVSCVGTLVVLGYQIFDY